MASTSVESSIRDANKLRLAPNMRDIRTYFNSTSKKKESNQDNIQFGCFSLVFFFVWIDDVKKSGACLETQTSSWCGRRLKVVADDAIQNAHWHTQRAYFTFILNDAMPQQRSGSLASHTFFASFPCFRFRLLVLFWSRSGKVKSIQSHSFPQIRANSMMSTRRQIQILLSTNKTFGNCIIQSFKLEKSINPINSQTGWPIYLRKREKLRPK